MRYRAVALTLAVCQLAATAYAETPKSVPSPPPRSEGEGPFPRLILRGGFVVDGTGAPARGPVDIVIEGNRITRVASVGAPGGKIDEEERPKAKPGDKEIDIAGMYVLPGLIDLHGHIGGVEQGTPAEYVYKLWLGHGVTTVRDPGSGNGIGWTLEQKEKSARNEITAPRLEAYVFFGQDHEGPFTAPDDARRWVDEMAKRGADGIKFFGYRPDVYRAALDQAKKKGLRTTCHHAQLSVTRMTALDSARWGLNSMEHWYGLPESMFEGRTVQDYPHRLQLLG